MQHRIETIETQPGSGRPAGADVRWKRALKGVVGAAFRLHHYRFVRTRMLHDALAASRCGSSHPERTPKHSPDNPG